MAAPMKVARQFFRFGKVAQTDRTTPYTTAYWDIPIGKGGFTLNPSYTQAPLETLHGRKGNRYVLDNQRNADGGQIVTPLYPEFAAYLFNLAQPSDGSQGDLSYWTVDHWWTAGTLYSAGTYRGRRVVGTLFTGWSLSIDRNTGDALQLTLPAMANDFIPQTGTAPDLSTLSFPSNTSSGPYQATHTFIDWNVQDSYVTSGFSGDEAQLRMLSVTLDRAVQLRGFRPDSAGVERREMTWTDFQMATPTVQIEATIAFSDIDDASNEELQEYFEDASAKQGSLRIMAKHARSAKHTGVTIPTAATPGAKTVTSLGTYTSDPGNNNPAVNDYLLIRDTTGTVPNVEVAKLTAMTGSYTAPSTPPTNIQFTTALAHETGATVQIFDKAFEIKIPKMTLSAGPIEEEGEDLVIKITAQAQLQDSQNDVLDVSKSYND